MEFVFVCLFLHYINNDFSIQWDCGIFSACTDDSKYTSIHANIQKYFVNEYL
jgi:hypothetical protein